MRLQRAIAGAIAAAMLVSIGPQAAAAETPAVRWVHPALWRVQSGDTTVFLFGSVHVVPGNLAWSDAIIDSAIRSSDVFVFEASLGGTALSDMRDIVRRQGMLPQGQKLRDLLSPAALADYSSLLRDMGLQPQALDRFRPWLALVYISVHRTTTRSLTAPGSVDPAVMSYAQSHGREMRYLETARQQLAIFGDMDRATEIATFEASLSEYLDHPGQNAQLLDAWAKGDSETLAAMLAQDFERIPAAHKALIDDRNSVWAVRIEEFLHEPKRTFFVTVGAGHYGGTTGVLALLCRAGERVMRVGRDGAADEGACNATRGSLSR